MNSCSLPPETQHALSQHCSSAGQELGDSDQSSSLSLQQQTFNFQLLLAMCYNSHLLLGSMNDPSLDPLLAKSINAYVYSLVESVTFKRLRCKPGMSVDELLRGLAVCLPTSEQPPQQFRPTGRFDAYSNGGDILGTGRRVDDTSGNGDGVDEGPATDAGLEEARDPVVILYLEHINVLPVDCQDLLCQMMTHNKWLTSDPERGGIVQYHSSSDVVAIGTVSNRRSELRLGCVGEIKDDLLDCFFSMLQPRDVFDVIAATTKAKDSKTVVRISTER